MYWRFTKILVNRCTNQTSRAAQFLAVVLVWSVINIIYSMINTTLQETHIRWEAFLWPPNPEGVLVFNDNKFSTFLKQSSVKFNQIIFYADESGGVRPVPWQDPTHRYCSPRSQYVQYNQKEQCRWYDKNEIIIHRPGLSDCFWQAQWMRFQLPPFFVLLLFLDESLGWLCNFSLSAVKLVTISTRSSELVQSGNVSRIPCFCIKSLPNNEQVIRTFSSTTGRCQTY